MDARLELTRLGRQKPFIPFRIKLSDGRSIEIDRPHMFALGLTTILIGYMAGTHDQLPLAEVVSIEELQRIG